MKRQLDFLTAWVMAVFWLMALAWAAGAAASESWLFRPSTYSHDPLSGYRVAQYRPEKPAEPLYDDTYLQSGYRHVRAGLRGADGSHDYLHVVQTWGAGELIRPYGEWLYPYRAGATPYGPWGNPQGPWTLPFDSWINPYGLGRLPNPPWWLPGPTPFQPDPRFPLSP
jgi:hypothetical protein